MITVKLNITYIDFISQEKKRIFEQEWTLTTTIYSRHQQTAYLGFYVPYIQNYFIQYMGCLENSNF